MESSAVTSGGEGMAITEWVADGVDAIGSIISAIFGTSGAWATILPVVGLGIGMWVIGRGISFVRNLVAGF